ncbi:MAG: HAMP domain-containing histidine kinase, partial [Candidatus Omnitrophica bacterium]|nr:HAMP domain-containing histidine kinase [Candidatus Omnitrophota bacterium]
AIESGRIKLDCEDYDLCGLIRDVIEEFLLITKKENKEIVYHSLAENCRVYGDPARIRQVVVNLISNAVKYTNDNGVVEVTLKNQENDVVFIVADNGPGIEPEEQEKIFEPYHRAKLKKTKKEGTGLGLPIVKEILELHGGKITLEESTMQGSVFLCLIPRRCYVGSKN